MAKITYEKEPTRVFKKGDLVLWQGGVCILAWASKEDSAYGMRLISLTSGSSYLLDEAIYEKLSLLTKPITLSNE